MSKVSKSRYPSSPTSVAYDPEENFDLSKTIITSKDRIVKDFYIKKKKLVLELRLHVLVLVTGDLYEPEAPEAPKDSNGHPLTNTTDPGQTKRLKHECEVKMY